MEGLDPADGRRVRRWHSGPKGLLSVAWRFDGRIVTLAQQEYMGPAAHLSAWEAEGGAPRNT
jgi:hypothetical protein